MYVEGFRTKVTQPLIQCGKVWQQKERSTSTSTIKILFISGGCVNSNKKPNRRFGFSSSDLGTTQEEPSSQKKQLPADMYSVLQIYLVKGSFRNS